MDEYEIKVVYQKEVPSLIDGDIVLAYQTVDITEFIHGTLDEISARFTEIKSEHPGAAILCS